MATEEWTAMNDVGYFDIETELQEMQQLKLLEKQLEVARAEIERLKKTQCKCGGGCDCSTSKAPGPATP